MHPCVTQAAPQMQTLRCSLHAELGRVQAANINSCLKAAVQNLQVRHPPWHWHLWTLHCSSQAEVEVGWSAHAPGSCPRVTWAARSRAAACKTEVSILSCLQAGLHS